jgi:hypothetical protein
MFMMVLYFDFGTTLLQLQTEVRHCAIMHKECGGTRAAPSACHFCPVIPSSILSRPVRIEETRGGRALPGP